MDYRNVKKNPAVLAEFLKASNGHRDVPLILEGKKVTVGFGGS